MNLPHLPTVTSFLALLAQEPVSGFTAENVAARPEIDLRVVHAEP